MSEKIGFKIGYWFYRKGKISEDQIDMIRFAFEIMCSEFTEIIIILLYSIFTGQIFQTILYLVFFQILRQSFQGYHAKTILRCLLLTVSAYLMTMSLYSILPSFILILLLLFSLGLQVDYSLRKRQWNSMIASIILHIVVLTISIYLHDFQYFNLLVVIDFIASISLIPERRENI